MIISTSIIIRKHNW